MKHIKKALTANVYKKWDFEIPQKRKKVEDPSKDRLTARKFPVSTPYISGVSEQLQRVFRYHSFPSYHKPFNTLRSPLVSAKDKTPKEKQCVLIPQKCGGCE